jgi:transcriptional regulator with XRE-family HTH domain
MVERIRTLLEIRQLTPTQFADVIGVARPIVSHILSGRNKPSLEVVQRILAAMPDLAMPWLLNGTGPMLAGAGVAPVPLETAAVAIAPVAPEPVVIAAEARTRVDGPAVAEANRASVPSSEYAEPQPAITAAPTAVPIRASTSAPNRNRAAPKRFVASATSFAASPSAPAVAPPQPLAAPPELPPVVQRTDANPPISSPVPADEMPGAALASALFAGGDKPIRRIVIFYRDGSFADYQPE